MPLNLEDIEVVEDNKNVMRPDVMNFLMMASMVSQMTRIRKYFDDRTTEGWTENFNPVNVTPVEREIRTNQAAQTFFIVNDGPAQIWVKINQRAYSSTPLNLGETMFLNFETHKIDCFLVQCGAGLVATARAFVTG